MSLFGAKNAEYPRLNSQNERFLRERLES
jgi:hypothetical protein